MSAHSLPLVPVRRGRPLVRRVFPTSCTLSYFWWAWYSDLISRLGVSVDKIWIAILWAI